MNQQQIQEALIKVDELMDKQSEAHLLMQELRLRLMLELELERREFHWDQVVRWLSVGETRWRNTRGRLLLPTDIAGVIVKTIGGEEVRFEFDSAYPNIHRTKERKSNERTVEQVGPGREASGPT